MHDNQGYVKVTTTDDDDAVLTRGERRPSEDRQAEEWDNDDHVSMNNADDNVYYIPDEDAGSGDYDLASDADSDPRSDTDVVVESDEAPESTGAADPSSHRTRSMSVAELAVECGEWDVEALAAHPVTAFADHITSSRMRLLDIFKIIDARTHGHGRLSDSDMVQALREMGIPLSDDQISHLVEQIEHECGKITFGSLKRTMERHHKHVLRPQRKERHSWINHSMRKYSITTGHRKRERASAESPQWDPVGTPHVVCDDEWTNAGVEVPKMMTVIAESGPHLTSPNRTHRHSGNDSALGSQRTSVDV